MDRPEFNDCQRFVVSAPNGSLVYDSLFAVFAADTIRGAWTALQGTHAAGQLFAIIYTFGNGPGPMGDPYKGGTYDNLFIGPGWNCLYLYYTPTVLPVLRARMVKNGPTNKYCPPSLSITTPAPSGQQDLPLHRIPATQSFGEPDVPPVARWDWNAAKRLQFIGVYCGAGWCEIGPSGSPAYIYGAGVAVKQRRLAQIKGWYDQQLLAVGNPAHPRPGPLGTIFPNPYLGEFAEPDFAGNWIPVSYVAVQTAYTGAKMPFEQTDAQGPPEQKPMPPYLPLWNVPHVAGVVVNTIELCEGPLSSTATAGHCQVPAAYVTTAPCYGPYTGSTPPTPWWRRVRNKAGTVVLQVKCVQRYTHVTMPGAEPIPGTVRWRWTVKDESSWAGCHHACCQ